MLADEFEPYFQPLVRLADGGVVGYEALIRWQHPQRGVLVPGDFLPVAEDSGLIEAIDWQMYRLACDRRCRTGPRRRFLTINISPRHFQDEDFDQRLLALAAETGFDPAKLRIEVTEGTLLGDPDAVAKILERLRDAGVEAALDDFGTGYSSLGYVHRFPLKMIKIDRSFVDPLGGDRSHRSSAIVSAILALAHSLGVEVVAEGVETEAQRQALMAMGASTGRDTCSDGRKRPRAGCRTGRSRARIADSVTPDRRWRQPRPDPQIVGHAGGAGRDRSIALASALVQGRRTAPTAPSLKSSCTAEFCIQFRL